MQWARSRTIWAGVACAAGLAMTIGAAPPTPSYHQVLQRIDQVKQRLSGDGPSSEKAGNWNTFFDAVAEELGAQGRAETAAERLGHLERLGRMRDALATARWGPSDRVRASLDEWLAPRLEVARALDDLEQAVAQLPGSVATDAETDADAGTEPDGGREPTDTDADEQPPAAAAAAAGEADGATETADEAPDRPRDRESVLKEKWMTYVDRLNAALRDYESAESVSNRLNASRKLRGGLASLRWTQAYYPWAPAARLASALDVMLDRPNLNVVADVSIVSPFLNQIVVKPEVIAFKGQISYVQPGPKTGFGLMYQNDGIAFYNSQYSYSTTPVSGFQQQVASDPQGRRAANLYQFGATIYNTNHVTAVAVLTPDGLVVDPQNAPNVTAAFGASPQPGHGPGFMRAIAGLVGYDRERILSEIRQQALPRIQQETAQGTAELAAIKSAQEAAQQNAMIRQYLVGNRTLRFQDFAVSELGLASNPWAALVSGVLRWASDTGPQIGADFPQPPEFVRPEGGLTLDLHLNSALTNLAAGYFRTGQASQVESLLVKIVPPEGEAPMGEGLEVSQNASYEDLLRAIDDVRSRSSDPNAVALRVIKPGDAPAFAVDSEGNLVAFFRDVTIEVPAPENFGNQGLFGFGGNPRVLRFIIEEAELTISADFTPEAGGRAVAIQGQVESVTYGGAATTVVAVGDEEDDTTTLNLLNRSGALGVLAGKLQGQEINTSVPTNMLPGFVVASISDLDPTGWMRVVLRRDPYQVVPAPNAVAASPAPANYVTQPAYGYAPPATMTPAGYAAR